MLSAVSSLFDYLCNENDMTGRGIYDMVRSHGCKAGIIVGGLCLHALRAAAKRSMSVFSTESPDQHQGPAPMRIPAISDRVGMPHLMASA